MTVQQNLPFRSAITSQPKLVRLGTADQFERQRCVDFDLDLPPSLLEDTRCQRMGVSRGFFAGMFLSDRNRELADEMRIMRQDNWEYEPCAWVDWKKAERHGKFVAGMFQSQLVELVAAKLHPVEGRQKH